MIKILFPVAALTFLSNLAFGGGVTNLTCTHKNYDINNKSVVSEFVELKLSKTDGTKFQVTETQGFPKQNKSYPTIRVTNLECHFSSTDARIADCSGVKFNSGDPRTSVDFTNMGFESKKSVETKLDPLNGDEETTQDLLLIEAHAVHNYDRTSARTWAENFQFHLSDCIATQE